MPTKLKHFSISVFILLLTTSCGNDIENTKASQGILDLTNWDLSKNGIVSLNGQWEFYWNELLEPHDFTEKKAENFIELPGVWNDYVYDGQEISGEGYSTFRLRVKNNFGSTKLGMRIPYHFTSYKLWLNNDLISSNGRVAKSKIMSIPQTLPEYIYFNSSGEELIFTLQVSNYAFEKGGAPASYKLGTESQIKQLRSRNVALDIFLAGILFIMAFHHLGLFFLMKKEVYTLYFSIVCMLVMFRTIGLGESFLIELFPDFDFEAYTRLVFVGFFIAPPLFLLFIQRLFPLDSKRIVGRIFMMLGVIFSGCLLFPATVSTQFVLPYMFVLLLLYSYMFYILIKACSKKREGAYIALFGTAIMMFTVVNDVLFDNQAINTGYYSSYGLVFFIFSQSFLLSLKFSSAFTAVKSLSLNIKKINIANSRFVPSEFLSFLGKESITDVELGDHVTKHMTIFFADIRSFTTLSESMSPEDNFNFLNSLLNRFGPIIRENNGFIDKFIGDGIMALFANSPTDALLAAGDVLKALEEYNAHRLEQGFVPIRIGIGINSGTLMLGTIGEKERMDGTVISDSVNLASRLEDLTKIFSANIIVSEHVLLEVKQTLDLDYRFLGSVQVKGKNQFTAIYDIFSFDTAEVKTIKHKIKEPFERAIHLYENDKLEEAKALFEEVETIFPDDLATKYYLSLIEGK